MLSGHALTTPLLKNKCGSDQSTLVVRRAHRAGNTRSRNVGDRKKRYVNYERGGGTSSAKKETVEDATL